MNMQAVFRKSSTKLAPSKENARPEHEIQGLIITRHVCFEFCRWYQHPPGYTWLLFSYNMASVMEEDAYLDHSDLDESDEDSDEELQKAFTSGKIKPGLNNLVEKEEKVYINKVTEMNEKLSQLKQDLVWLERLDVTGTDETDGQDTKESKKGTGQDDFKREMKFYKQAQMAVSQALPLLKKLGILTTRPEDYFAEMVKTDDHMQKVRQKLLTKELSMEKSEKAKKLREMKKFGKKVQHEVMQKRQQEKRQMLESVKKFRKGQRGKPEFMQDEDDFDVNAEKGTKRPAPSKTTGKSFKRQRKDTKYGFGGKKRAGKRNTADSAADMSSFSSVKHSKAPRTKSKKTKNKRLGKSRRQGLKGKGKGK